MRMATADPVLGRQLQEHAIPGLMPEARITPYLEPSAGGLTRMLAKIKLHAGSAGSRSETGIPRGAVASRTRTDRPRGAERCCLACRSG